MVPWSRNIGWPRWWQFIQYFLSPLTWDTCRQISQHQCKARLHEGDHIYIWINVVDRDPTVIAHCNLVALYKQVVVPRCMAGSLVSKSPKYITLHIPSCTLNSSLQTETILLTVAFDLNWLIFCQCVCTAYCDLEHLFIWDMGSCRDHQSKYCGLKQHSLTFPVVDCVLEYYFWLIKTVDKYSIGMNTYSFDIKSC